MFELFKSDRCSAGVVHFRGNLPTRPSEFEFLKTQRIDLEPAPVKDDSHWAMRLRHPAWGTADVVCPRGQVPALPHLEFVPRLSEKERIAIKDSRSALLVSVPAKQKSVLRDRKLLLRFMGAIMGDDGVGAIDAQSMLVWTRAMLDDELAHEADLDVESLYCLHAVQSVNESPEEKAGKGKSKPPCTWAHTHGLAELGAFDFDILRPSKDVTGRGSDMLRAIAYAIVEKKVGPREASFQIAHPGGFVRLVPAQEFTHAAAGEFTSLRRMDDDSHEHDRSVLCEPARRGLRALFAGEGVIPSRFLSREAPDQMVTIFTDAATELMAQRARQTVGVFERVASELREHKLPTLAKIGYPTDDGRGGGREHMWFQVHDFRSGAIEGTLINKPFNIAGMKEGDRGWHDVEKLTDWSIMTPMGTISPRNLHPLHQIREQPEMIKLMKLMGGLAGS